MGRSLTADEARQESISQLGQALGELFHELWQEVARLYGKWNEYVELFGTNQDRLNILNQSAARFFRTVQDSLLRDVLLHIARLTDPSQTFGKDNLTIQRLPSLIQNRQAADVVQTRINETLEATKFCRDWRNRWLAHHDLDLALSDNAKPLEAASRKNVREALASLAGVLNAVMEEHAQGSTAFTEYVIVGGARHLLYVLHDALTAQKEREERFRNGTYTEADLASRQRKL